MVDQPSDTNGYTGFQTPTTAGSERNIEQLHIAGQHDERRTMMPVRVVVVHGGGVDAAPTADVVPIVHQTDGLGNPTPHGMVYGVAVGRVHSGSGAIISDPVAGDVYMMTVADRDISKLKANGGQPSAPDTFRRGSPSDGVLHHAMLTGAPKQALFFKPDGGIKIFDKGGAVIETSSDGKTVTVIPAAGGTIVLGGDPSKGGTFGFVQTDQGASTVVKAKV